MRLCVLSLLWLAACSGPESKRIAVGVLWEPAAPEPCTLDAVQPAGAARGEQWRRATGSGKHLVVQALAEGKAKVQCEGKSFELELVAPASMQVRLAESGPFKAGDELELFPVITLDGKDSGGKPLDMGRGLRLEGVEWQVTGPLVIAGSGKQSEVGKETIHLGGKSAGKGTIKASWLGLSSELSIELE